METGISEINQESGIKVIHLVSSIFGGAGIAANRLNEALSLHNIDSEILSRDNEFKREFSTFDNFRSSSLTLTQRLLIQKNLDLMTPVSIDFTHKVEKRLLEANVLHLHSSYNFVSLNKLLRYQNPERILVVTLHDQRALTGGCHYSGDCVNYRNNCKKCPNVRYFARNLVVKSKQMFNDNFLKLRDVIFISPSYWMKENLSNMLIEPLIRSHVVSNPIPDIFRPETTPSGVGHRKKEFAFIAANLNNPFKNLELIKRAFWFMSKEEILDVSLSLIGVGEVNGFPPGTSLRVLGTKSESEIAHLLKGVDVVLVPSLEDNSPNVIGESIASGCFVIGSNVGGIPELLSEFKFPTCKPDDPFGLYQEIIRAPLRGEVVINRNLISQKFGYASIAAQLEKIYRNYL